MSLDLYIYFLILILVALNGIVKYKRLSVPFKALTILLCIILISETIARAMAIRIRNSYPPYHILCMLQYAGYSFIYSRLLQQQKISRYILLSILPFTVMSLVNTLRFQHFFQFPSNIIMLSYIIFIGLSLLLFLQMLREPEAVNITEQGVFWFNCAVLVYSTAVPVCFGLLSYLIKHRFYTDFLQSFIEYLTFAYYLILGWSVQVDSIRNRANG